MQSFLHTLIRDRAEDLRKVIALVQDGGPKTGESREYWSITWCRLGGPINRYCRYPQGSWSHGMRSWDSSFLWDASPHSGQYLDQWRGDPKSRYFWFRGVSTGQIWGMKSQSVCELATRGPGSWCVWGGRRFATSYIDLPEKRLYFGYGIET